MSDIKTRVVQSKGPPAAQRRLILSSVQFLCLC